MSKNNLEKTLKSELEILNDVIDRRIIKGLSYAREARRHRFLLQSLSQIRRSQSSWMTRSFSSFSII